MITDAQEFRQKLLEIQNSTLSTFTTLPSNEPRFIIDANTREISVPAEFNFLAVKNDHKAETIYFEIDRYFDDVDLSKHTCVIQFLNKDARTLTYNEGICAVTVMDVITLDGKIIFGWQITNDATQFAGDLYFAIRFYSIDENGYFTYSLNTLASESIVLNTLDVKASSSGIPSSILLQWIAKISEVSAQVESNTQAIKEINEKLENHTGGGINFTVDDTLSQVSTNPIQNQAVVAGLEKKVSINSLSLGYGNNGELYIFVDGLPVGSGVKVGVSSEGDPSITSDNISLVQGVMTISTLKNTPTLIDGVLVIS